MGLTKEQFEQYSKNPELFLAFINKKLEGIELDTLKNMVSDINFQYAVAQAIEQNKKMIDFLNANKNIVGESEKLNLWSKIFNITQDKNVKKYNRPHSSLESSSKPASSSPKEAIPEPKSALRKRPPKSYDTPREGNLTKDLFENSKKPEVREIPYLQKELTQQQIAKLSDKGKQEYLQAYATSQQLESEKTPAAFGAKKGRSAQEMRDKIRPADEQKRWKTPVKPEWPGRDLDEKIREEVEGYIVGKTYNTLLQSHPTLDKPVRWGQRLPDQTDPESFKPGEKEVSDYKECEIDFVKIVYSNSNKNYVGSFYVTKQNQNYPVYMNVILPHDIIHEMHDAYKKEQSNKSEQDNKSKYK